MNRLLVAALAALVISGPLFAQDRDRRSRGVEGVLYDANGKRMGPLDPQFQIETDNVARVLAYVGGVLVYIPVSSSVIRDGSGAVFLDTTKVIPRTVAPLGGGVFGVGFESTDCSGQGFVSSIAYSGVVGAHPSVTLADGSGGAVVYIATPTQPLGRNVLSALVSTGVCQPATGVSGALWIPVTRVQDLSLVYKAPFALR